MDRAHGEPGVLQFLDPNITEVQVVRFTVVLQGNVAFQGAIADTGLFSFSLFI